MMSKFPLTSTGVQDLMNELYALPQAELQLEADAIGSDFRLWVNEHLELNPAQINYLNQIDENWITNAAVESKYFMENRLPIALSKDEEGKSEEEGEDRGKLLDLEKKQTSSFNQVIGFTESEQLTYLISYTETTI